VAISDAPIPLDPITVESALAPPYYSLEVHSARDPENVHILAVNEHSMVGVTVRREELKAALNATDATATASGREAGRARKGAPRG
jgi:hypothetical protein